LASAGTPEVVERVIRSHSNPAIGKRLIGEVRLVHVDGVLARVVGGGAPNVANNALRPMYRKRHIAAKRNSPPSLVGPSTHSHESR
jgi:hypothetical protein